MTSHRSVRAEGADIRKTLQLCKQVERTLSLVLTGECSDDVLRDLLVTSVEPIDGTSQLLVTVQPFDIDSTPDAIVIVEHLHRAKHRLRAAVAQSVHRRKVPDFCFQVGVMPDHSTDAASPQSKAEDCY